MGALAAFVVGDVLRIRRRHVEDALTRAGVARPSGVARAMYRSLGRGLAELLATVLFRAPRALVEARPPTAFLDYHARSGRGAVIATAHTGNWDVTACAIAAHTPLTVVTKRLSVGWLDGIWQRARARRGVQLVEAGRASRIVARALARRELVAMLIDQAPERRRAVVRTTFLGALVWVDLAPALAALRARVPLVAAFPYRDGDGTLAVDIAAIIEPPLRPNRRWAEATMIEATRLLEAFVERRPEQWLWMHRRWKDLPEAPIGATRLRVLPG
ncbi:MAG TPA: lysophospholipid acyltransferase family protein [Polyangiaceae bacterium]|nr:lysophospholipid acyltransferase family protein [Polyangiaceae bacterium]